MRKVVFVMFCLLLAGCASRQDAYESPIFQKQGASVVPGVERAEKGDAFVTITALGQGIEPDKGTPQQKQILSGRAAIVDAYRNLSERITGVLIDAYTRQGNNSISFDQVTLESSSYLRGAQIVGIDYLDGVATATVRVTLPVNSSRFINTGIVGGSLNRIN